MPASTAARRAGFALVALLVAGGVLQGCATKRAPIRTEQSIDLPRFMGDWYVIANIPTSLEEGAHNAVESYRLDDDGTIATTFTFRDGSFDGEPKRYTPRGFVRDGSSNAVWGMQFVWPIKAEYRIVFVDDAYERTIIGRSKRDYVWIMARTPTIPEEDYEGMVRLLVAEGYDTSRLRRVPQKWTEDFPRSSGRPGGPN